MQRPIALLFALGLIIGIAGALLFRAAPPPAAPEFPSDEVARPSVSPTPPTLPAYDPTNPEAREEAIRASRLPSEVTYPIEAKYREDQLSSVPHQLIAAYSDPSGKSRTFILTVTPDTSQESLQQLIEDIRAKNLDTNSVDIRIYDSNVAATHPLQAGASKDPHLVATYSRAAGSVTYELHGEPAPTP